MSEINNLNKKAKWIKKSANQSDEYVCSLCGERNWYNANQTLCQSDYCPNCGAKMTQNDLFIDINEAIDFCKNAYDDTTITIGKYRQIMGWLNGLRFTQRQDEPEDVVNAMYSGNAHRGVCPECEFSLSRNEHPVYCGKCGQKLKWN